MPKAKTAPTRPATPGTPKPAPAFHKRRRALLAWMREDPFRALGYVAHAWFQSAKYAGRHDHAAMAEILGALAEASPAELTARNGPRAWARKQRPKMSITVWTSAGRRVPPDGSPQRIVDLPRSKAEAGRRLVSRIAWWLKEHGVDLDAMPRQGRRELLVAGPPRNGISFAEWVGLVVARDAPAAGWGKPSSTDPDEVDRRVVAEVRRAIARLNCTPVSIAIAVLTGWGMPRAKAKDALRHVERA